MWRTLERTVALAKLNLARFVSAENRVERAGAVHLQSHPDGRLAQAVTCRAAKADVIPALGFHLAFRA